MGFDRIDELTDIVRRVETKLDMLIDALADDDEEQGFDLDGNDLSAERELHTSLG